jgi:hypothetical protein
MYMIYFIHPQAGEVVKHIIKGKSEAMKCLNKLNKEKDETYFIKEWKE